MSKIEVDAIEPQSGTSLTLGASGDTITIPSGATLVNNGTATGFASIAWQSSIVTASTLTAEAGKGYWINTTSNACTITLPASASVGDQIIFSDYLRTWGTNAVTINQNSLNFQGNSTPNPVYDTNGESVDIVYSGATKGWIPNNDDDVTLETPQPYSVDFLVIAGGAGGGVDSGGGGGAGGYRNSYSTETSGGGGSSEASLAFIAGTVYTITVGSGGAGSTSDSASGINGVNSSISGSGLTTLTSTGGGGASSNSGSIGSAGGSGGGAGVYSSGGVIAGGSGTANQGYAGGSANGGPYPDRKGGGGGGASAVGVNASIYVAGNGGAGLASSITGSSITRAGGGGGGGTNSAGTPGSGGSGGGGAGTVSDNTSATSGTVNTGGGGGGKGAGSGNAGNGGLGVVILRMPTVSYSETTSGSPTVSTSGTDTILIYNASGSYTG